MLKAGFNLTLLAGLFILASCAGEAPPAASGGAASKGEIIRTVIPGQSLEGDIAQDDTPLDALIYLPPSYASDPQKRYPLLVLLHGFWSSPEQWESEFISISALYSDALAAGEAQEMIIVMPMGADRLGGGFFVDGAASGDWETYVAEDVVGFVDSAYRTLPARESRGVAGHSMGGYGALSVAASRPDVFSAVYAMSPCCGDMIEEFGTDTPHWASADELDDMAAFESSQDFLARVLIAIGAAWTPDASAPLMSRRPVEDGVIDEAVLESWRERTLLRLVPARLDNLKRYTAIGLDVGDQEEFSHIAASTRALSEQMESLGLRHAFVIYPGDHVSGVGAQLREEVLPFFSEHLDAD